MSASSEFGSFGLSAQFFLVGLGLEAHKIKTIRLSGELTRPSGKSGTGTCDNKGNGSP